MTNEIKAKILKNGQSMPMLGLGTYNSPKGETYKAIKIAIDSGYRHIDTAHIYNVEDEIGDAIKEKINDGTIKRDDLFVVSKLWNTYHRPDLVEPALRVTLKNLQLDYVNLYLIHWPVAFKEGLQDVIFPKNAECKILFSNVDFVDTYRAMEALVEKGLTKSIGLSNFNKCQIERILDMCTIYPVVNQIECHPYLTQEKLSNFCKSKDIAVTAYSPLGSPSRPWAPLDEKLLLNDPDVKVIAVKYKKTPGQVLIRYQIDRGHIVIPKSSNKERIISNIVDDFHLTEDDMNTLNKLNKNLRVMELEEFAEHPNYPFFDEY